MTGKYKFALLVLALIFINIATWFVTGANQRSGIYPIDADSIGIPIAGTWFHSLLVLPQLFLISFLGSFGFVTRLCSRDTRWSIAIGIVLLALYVNVGLFAISGVAEWMLPNHYLIAVGYLLLFLVLVIFLLLDMKLYSRTLHSRGMR